MRLSSAIVCLLALAISSPFAVACAPAVPQSRVATGKLYATGNVKYDEYFREVNALQSQTDAWEQERLASRKSLVDQLALSAGVPDATLIDSLFNAIEQLAAGPYKVEGTGESIRITSAEGKAEGPLFRSIEVLIRFEIERSARRKRGRPQAVKLAEKGKELYAQTRKEFNNAAFGESRQNVELEIDSSMETLKSIDLRTAREADEADAFVVLVKRALKAPRTVCAEVKPSTKPGAKPGAPGDPKTPTAPQPKTSDAFSP
jgi:hypothetical protein